MIKKYGLYLIRWQLSTPILYLVLILLTNLDPIIVTIIANFIGGLIFFWVDKFIFKNLTKTPHWEIKDGVICNDCGKKGRGYRIVEWLYYNRTKDSNPQFRCEFCKDVKFEEVKQKINRKKSRS